MTALDYLPVIFSPQSAFNEAFDAKETIRKLDGREYYTWRAIRRQKLNAMTWNIIWLTFHLLVACNPVFDDYQKQQIDLVKGRAPVAKAKYGITYELVIDVTWALALIIKPVVTILWFTIFQWFYWPFSNNATETDSNSVAPDTVNKTTNGGKLGYPEIAFFGLSYFRLCLFAYHLYEAVLHIDSKPVLTSDAEYRPASFRESRKTRLCLVAGMFMSLALGAAIMRFWFVAGLAQVTTLEYAIIIVPIQLTLGLTVASIFQAWSEEHRGLPADPRPPIFERGLDGKLTLEGARQALRFLSQSGTNMGVVAEILAVNDKETGGKKESAWGERTEGWVTIDQKLTKS